MPVTFLEITQGHLKEDRLVTLNAILTQLRDECNRLGGYGGTIKLVADLDLQNHRIINLADAVDDTDALSKEAGTANFGADKVRQQVEVVGDSFLNTARRLNDNTQRERSSAFLNRTASTPPASNTASITLTNLGGSTRVDVSAGTAKMADKKTLIPFSARSDTFVNPGAGVNVYYYYVDEGTSALQVDGPYTSNTSDNAMNANYDGRIAVGAASVAAGGGGTGGGGGDNDPLGCAEVGTSLILPSGGPCHFDVLPNSDWVEFETEDGRHLAIHPDTLVSVFVKGRELQKGMRVEALEGKWSTLRNLWNSKRDSHKMKGKVPGGTYYANGHRLHNAKPR